MYTTIDFQTKKDLKNAVKNGTTVRVFQPGPFGGTEPTEGEITLEGPHYPKAHTWYARAVLKNGKIISVK
jgi:hypothetical protein